MLVSKAQSIVFNYPPSMTISRFQSFSGYIPQDLASHLQINTVKLLVNGRDCTPEVKFTKDDSGGLIFSFDPEDPLPVGKIKVEIFALTLSNSTFSQSFSFLVNPSSDPDLQNEVNVLKKDPTSSEAHYLLGQLYEQKHLFKDAAYEYSRAVYFNPNNQEAREAYARVFSIWGEKSLVQSNVKVNVSLDDSLYSIGGPVLFEIQVSNNSPYPVQLDPRKSVLIDASGTQLAPLDDMEAYVQDEMDGSAISLDQYARLSYFLDTHKFSLLPITTLHTSTFAVGYLAFPRPSGGSTQVTLVISSIVENGQELFFKFPFLLP
jgi:hypothetical protein